MSNQQKQIIDQIEKERGQPLTQEQKQLLNQNYVKNNLLFLPDQILDFYEMFQLYADLRTKKVDMKDILMTAQTLGLNEKYQLVFRILQQIQQNHEQVAEQNNQSDNFDFETFVFYLTQFLGNTVTQEGREALFQILDRKQRNLVGKEELRQTADELRYNIGDQEVEEIVQNIGGFGQQGFDFDKFDKYVARKVEKKNIK